MEKYLYFDLDGTLYNLYKIPNWLERLRANDASVYNEAGYERKSLARIREVVRALKVQGWEIHVITWAGKRVEQPSLMFEDTKREKINWCIGDMPEIQYFHQMEYGENKTYWAFKQSKSVDSVHVLVDDNKLVRAEWRKAGPNFYTINASRGFVKKLQGLLG